MSNFQNFFTFTMLLTQRTIICQVWYEFDIFEIWASLTSIQEVCKGINSNVQIHSSKFGKLHPHLVDSNCNTAMGEGVLLPSCTRCFLSMTYGVLLVYFAPFLHPLFSLFNIHTIYCTFCHLKFAVILTDPRVY